jgi:hypothetical protein
MKKLLVASCFVSLNAFAQSQVIPYVTNFVYNAQVQVSNQNDYTVSCSGPVYMYLSSGYTDVQYYYDTVYNRNISYRTLFPTRPMDRINFTNHSIYCHKQ